VIDDLSHILRPDPESKGPRAYRKALNDRVSRAVLDVIGDWIERQAGRAP